MEGDAPFRRRKHVAFEELTDRRNKTSGIGHVVWNGHARSVVLPVSGNSSKRSHSFSHTRRPMAASSTERIAPDTWAMPA